MIDTKKLTALRDETEGLWGAAIDGNARARADADRAQDAWQTAMDALASGDAAAAIEALEEARNLAKTWGDDRCERRALVEVRASEMIGEVSVLVGADAGGDLGVIVRQALADDASVTAEQIADIVREARADARAE